MLRFPIILLSKILLISSVLTCQNQDTSSNDELSIATQNYAVLAEKTISYQADFDMESWGKMLADDVEFEMPDDSSQTSSVGKQAAIQALKKWKERNKIQTLKCSRFTQIPISSQKAMRFSDLSGVYVFSLFSGRVFYTDGSSSTLKMNYCFHFNKAKMIDRYYAFHDKINFTLN